MDSCGTYASTTTSGMPAVTCGSNFDSRLDGANGYYDTNNGSQLDQFAPGANLSSSDVINNNNRNGTKSRGDIHHLLRKRGFFSFMKKVANVVVSTVQKATAVAVAVTKSKQCSSR